MSSPEELYGKQPISPNTIGTTIDVTLSLSTLLDLENILLDYYRLCRSKKAAGIINSIRLIKADLKTQGEALPKGSKSNE